MGDRPWNRRSGHHQRVRLRLPLLEHGPLEDAEPVLLVDDHEAEVAERRRPADQGLRADHDPGPSRGDPLQHLFAPPRGLAADEQLDLDAAPGEEFFQRRQMLAGEQFRRRHDRRLMAFRPAIGPDDRLRRRPFGGTFHRRGHGGQQRVDRHRGLAAADVPLEQPVHRLAAAHVGGDLGAHPALGGGELEAEPGPDPAVEPGVHREHRGRPPFLLLAAVHSQRELEHEQFLVDEPSPGGLGPLRP